MRYRVETSDRAAAEREAAFLRLLRRSPEYAARWLQGLLEEIEKLAEFPGPRSHPIAREQETFGYEVRRLRYPGPDKRRSGTVYRVLFTIIPPPEGEDEAVIWILRILHGAQDITSEGTDENEEA